MTLSKVSFSDIRINDNWDHFDTFGGNFDFDTFKNDTFEIDTFERVIADRLPQSNLYIFHFPNGLETIPITKRPTNKSRDTAHTGRRKAQKGAMACRMAAS